MVKQHLRKLKRKDPRIGAWMKKLERIEDLDLPRRPNPYAALVRSIAYQQLHGKAAATIFKRFLALFPGERFPKPESILSKSISDLRGVGFSESKALAIQDIARKKQEGIFPSVRAMAKMTDLELIERLTVIRGVGPWTVQMLLIFEMGRADVWPHLDFGVQRGAQYFFGLRDHPKPKEILNLADDWAPYRSAVAILFWRIADQMKDKKKTKKARP